MQIELRQHTSLLRVAMAPISAIFAALLLCSVLIMWAGVPVLEAYFLLFKGAFGSSFALKETFTRSIPLIFTGLAVAVAFRSKFYNIGAEGQLYAGALAAVYFGTGMVTLPAFLMIPFLLLVGALAGGLLLLVPVLLKTRLKVDEVVTTLLLNFIVLLVVSYLIEGPWRDPMAMGWPQTASIIDEGVLPTLMSKGRLHAGLIIAVLAALLIWTGRSRRCQRSGWIKGISDAGFVSRLWVYRCRGGDARTIASTGSHPGGTVSFRGLCRR